MNDVKAELAEIRRRLGPYVALQGDEAFRLCDAEIARQLVQLINVVEDLVARLPKQAVAKTTESETSLDKMLDAAGFKKR